MFGRKHHPIAEHQARGDTARIYHEIRQTLRVTGVNLNFRTWAAYPVFFPAMWEGMQPIAATRAFEEVSDRLRSRAADLAAALPAPAPAPPLGGSQAYQLRGALALYHYVNPKLLLLTVLVCRGLRGQADAQPDRMPRALMPRVPFGAPPEMAAMEMVDDPPRDDRLRRVFRDIKATLNLPAVNSDYRTLALWPEYLDSAWAALKPIVTSGPFRQAAGALAQDARRAADAFPPPRAIHVRRLSALGEDAGAVMNTSERFEALLPSLILNIALLSRAWWDHDALRRSPFPFDDRQPVLRRLP